MAETGNTSTISITINITMLKPADRFWVKATFMLDHAVLDLDLLFIYHLLYLLIFSIRRIGRETAQREARGKIYTPQLA